MSLSEAVQAVPERLPAGLDYSALGSRFESITQKRSIHIQPASGNTFSPEGIRIIRFNITSNDYMVPETFRVQARFSVTNNAFVPLGPMSLLFSRVRVISNGVLLSDESYFDRLNALHHEWMGSDTFKDLCAESFQATDMSLNGTTDFETINAGKSVRIQMPFVTTNTFTQAKLLPLRWVPLVVEMELQSSFTTCCDTTNGNPQWTLSDVNALCDVVSLDPALDAAIQERHLTDMIPMKMRTWSTQKQVLNPAAAAEFTLTLLKGVSRLTSICITFEGPDPGPAQKKVTTLYFPPNTHTHDPKEEGEFWIQIGDRRMPEYPVRGVREAWYRARLGMCHGPTSNMNYLTNLRGFGGSNEVTAGTAGGADEIGTPGKHYFALIDCEKLCGHADYTGLDVKGGVSLYAFFRHLISNANHGITAAYFHVNYMQHVVLSSSGVEVLE